MGERRLLLLSRESDSAAESLRAFRHAWKGVVRLAQRSLALPGETSSAVLWRFAASLGVTKLQEAAPGRSEHPGRVFCLVTSARRRPSVGLMAAVGLAD